MVTGWLEPGFMYNPVPSVGSAQDYFPTVCNADSCVVDSTSVNANVITPPYCQAPYTADYHQSATWDYSGLKCARFGEYDMGLKRTPSYFFVTTEFHDRKFIMAKCSASNANCNANTPGVDIVGDSCKCVSASNYYAINPEGMKIFLRHEFSSYPFKGNSRTTGAAARAILRAPLYCVFTQTWQALVQS